MKGGHKRDSSTSRDGPANFLEKYSDYLQADAFGGYDYIYAGKTVIEVALFSVRAENLSDRHEQALRLAEIFKNTCGLCMLGKCQMAGPVQGDHYFRDSSILLQG